MEFQSAGIDDLLITAAYTCASDTPSASPSIFSSAIPSLAPTVSNRSPVLPMTCSPEHIVVKNDFESDVGALQAESFSNGAVARDGECTQFLGQLGIGREEVTKTVDIPVFVNPVDSFITKAESVFIEFFLYQIDFWSASTNTDEFFVKVNGISINIGEMSSASTSMFSSEQTSGIAWSRQVVKQSSQMCFGDEPDKKFLVELTVPASLFPNNSIQLGFLALTSQKLEFQSAGVDDLVITAAYRCPSETSSSSPTIAFTSESLGTTTPTRFPTRSPTKRLSLSPTIYPSKSYSLSPSNKPSSLSSSASTSLPSPLLTSEPSDGTFNLLPGVCPPDLKNCPDGTTLVRNPTTCEFPDCVATATPSKISTEIPTLAPTKRPTMAPTSLPTKATTVAPTGTPTRVATDSPTGLPTNAPSYAHTELPTYNPSNKLIESPVCPPGMSLADVKQCPDGFIVGRDVATCAYLPCPNRQLPTPPPTQKPTPLPSLLPTPFPTPSPTQFPTAFPTTTCPEGIDPTDQILCADGVTFRGRDISTKDCAFLKCPVCTDDTKICSDGTTVTRDITKGCHFAACPTSGPTTDLPIPSPSVKPTRQPVAASLSPRVSPSPIGSGEYPLRNTFSGDSKFGPCQADNEGIFGWENKKEERIIQFKYELELRSGISQSERNMIIFTLQRALMESTLPILFPDQCRGTEGLNRVRQRHLRELMVVGVSAYPSDEITDRKFAFIHKRN